MIHQSEIGKIRHRVLREVARLQWEHRLLDEIDLLPEILVNQHEQRYRCCEYKEKAIYAERIKLALGLTPGGDNHKKPLGQLLEKAYHQEAEKGTQVEVIDIACDNCPINTFFVTNACRNCVVHSCQQSCPKGAISIVHQQAYIDQTVCVECGLCKKSCQYGAIIEIHRPCEQSCGAKAIRSGNNRKAVIDQNKCTDCGNCVVSCPFGAISDRSQIIKLIRMLQEGKKVVGLLAPSIAGQFSSKAKNIASLKDSLYKLGFHSFFEVALGADMIAVAEGAEFVRQVPREIPFLTSSCCPAFVRLIELHQPDLLPHVSTYVSPMLVSAHLVKEIDPEAITVFIGPCIAKKAEAANSPAVDAVLTFEELAALLEGAGIGFEETSDKDNDYTASSLGTGFAQSGGVTQALKSALPTARQKELKSVRAEGLMSCAEVLKQVKSGELNANYIEGMACLGGCLGGPGVIQKTRFTQKSLKNYCSGHTIKTPLENPYVKEILSSHPSYIHREGRKES